MSFAARAARSWMTTSWFLMLTSGFAALSSRRHVVQDIARGISSASSARDPRVRPHGKAT